jgi:radical SAM protein with 4Fe4S-binding SPASM domain
MSAADAQDFLFQWHLTRRCNLRCAHCYDAEGAGPPHGDEMAPAELLDVADELADTLAGWSAAYGLAFAPEVSLTGGEPLLRPDLYGLARVLAGLGFRVSVLTNGTLAGPAEAERLARAGVASVQVSLEGPAPVHDRIRGQGSFAAAAAGIRNLAAAGLPVTVNMTLTRLNAPSFADMPGLCRSLGAARLGFSRLVPAGRGQGLADAALSTAELAGLYRRIADLGRDGTTTGGPAWDGVELVTSDPLASQLLFPPAASAHPAPDLGSLPLGGCAAGVSGITILPDGTLMPCRRLDLPVGNLRRDSLREIWAASPVLDRLRTRSAYGPRCSSCPRWAACRGCRAVAHAVTGDILADDPHCFLD